MRWPRAVASLVLLLSAVALAATPQASLQSGDLVTLDVSVVDEKGRPVEGLKPSDFAIKEDGRAADVATFTVATPTDPDVARSIVLFLDDIAMPYASVDAVRTIATAFLDNVSGRDEFAVVRLSRRNDEPFGDRTEAVERIRTYRPGSEPFSDGFTPSVALTRMATIARQLQSLEQRRKIIVCIGVTIVCNPIEPLPVSFLWPAWTNLISATADSNVAIYSLTSGRGTRRAGALAEMTGGAGFAGSRDLAPAVARILSDANHYYLLGYWSDGRGRGLHRVEVKVARKGVKVYARTVRGFQAK